MAVEKTLLVLRSGGSAEFSRPDVVDIKDYGVLVTRFEDGRMVQKKVYPWDTICVLEQTVKA